jgi:hypothetical protein
MNIEPTQEYQDAFRTVTGLEPTPANVLAILRHTDLGDAVHEELARIINEQQRAAPQ